MFTIVYTSRLDPAIGRAEVEGMLRQAQRNNRQRGVTGAWMMKDRDCLSALEGPPKVVQEVTELIWDDRRHFDFTLCEMKRIEHRKFDGWDLEFLDATPACLPRIEAHAGLRWLCEFAGGASQFVSHGLASQANPKS